MKFTKTATTREHIDAAYPLIGAGKATRKGACGSCGGHGFQTIPGDHHGRQFNRWCSCVLGKRLASQAVKENEARRK